MGRTAVAAVAGGGVSRMFGDNAIASVESLYYFFDETVAFSGTESIALGGVVSVTGKLSFRLN